MASIPTGSRSPTIICVQVGEVAQALFTTALKEETGLFFRSTETQLVTGDGAIHVQVPAANGQQIQAQSGMVLRVLPTNPEWKVWRDGIQYRDYDMGLCQFPSLAQRATAEGGGGPIIGARQISLRFALRFGQGRCLHVPPKGQEDTWVGPGRVAQVMVLGDTHPRSRLPMRAWTKQHSQGIYVRNTEDPNGEGANETNPNTPRGEESFTPPQHDGIGQAAPSPVIIRAGAGTGEVPSAGTLGGIPFTPAPKRRCVNISVLGGHRVLGGGDTSILQPSARTLSEDPPHQPPAGLGGTVLYIKANLSSNEGVRVRLLNYSGNHVCSSWSQGWFDQGVVRIFWQLSC
jgi:hypothetical protein